MKLGELRNYFNTELFQIYPKEELDSFFVILSEKYLDLSRFRIAMQIDLEITKTILEKFISAVKNLKEYMPIQYIIGETNFFGLSIIVNKDTLIPRPETEELVEWILEDQNKKKTKKPKGVTILDIATGSGCIAIALAKNLPNSKITALDISDGALKISIQNALLNRVDIEFIHQDILKIESLSIKYDVIVSNPPYVRELEKKFMQQNVLNYEPAIALFVKDEDPLLFYRTIAKIAEDHLTKEGFLYFEINEYLASDLISLLKNMGFRNVMVKKDIFGKDRMLKCQKCE